MSDDVRRPDVWAEMFPNRWLKAELFKGKSPTLTITDVTLEELPTDTGEVQIKGILSFEQTPKQLSINKTNGVCLRALFGNKPQEWIGKRVTFVSELDSFGKTKVDAIRIKGSPDIEQDVDVEIKMPKKKGRIRRLVKTGQAQSKAAPEANTSDNYIPPEVDQVTGEVKE